MAREIERKFIVTDDPAWQKAAQAAFTLRQGYLARGDGATVRVRLRDDGRAWLTVKSRAAGIARDEYEYEIPADDARGLLALCGDAVIEKTRHVVPGPDGARWEVDVFAGVHAGLVLAEIELPAADAPFMRPAWAGAEVTDDPRYANEALAFAAASTRSK